MARFKDFLDQCFDFIYGLFIGKATEEQRAWPISIRKQKEILEKVDGNQDKANLIMETMLLVGFNSLNDKETAEILFNFYNSLKWDKNRTKTYLDNFKLIRDSIGNSKKQQFSIFNKNRKVDSVEILKQTIDLINSDLTPDEIELIYKACAKTGSEISEARTIWEKEIERAMQKCENRTDALEEATKDYNIIIDLAEMTKNTTLSDARDVIGSDSFTYSSKSFSKTFNEMFGRRKKIKEKSDNNKEGQQIAIASNNDEKSQEVDGSADLKNSGGEELKGLNYDDELIKQLKKAILKSKKPNELISKRPLKDIFYGIFTGKTTEVQRAWPISIRKQKEILKKVGGDQDRANIIMETMLIIGFNSVSYKETAEVVYDFYKTLKWNSESAKIYLDRFELIRSSISNSKKQQFSVFNKNRKVDSVEILKQTIDLINSDLTPDEIELIYEACAKTGAEISEAKTIWEEEMERAMQKCGNGTNAIKEATESYNIIIDLAEMTKNTTLSDVRDVIGSDSFTYSSKSFSKTFNEMFGRRKKIKRKPDNNKEGQEIAIASNNDEKSQEVDSLADLEDSGGEELKGLNYDDELIKQLKKAIFKSKKTNELICKRPLKDIFEDFIKSFNNNGDLYAIEQQSKRTRKKAAGVAIVAGIALLKIFSLFSGTKSDEKEEPHASQSVAEESQTPESTASTPSEEFRRQQKTEIPLGDLTAHFDPESGEVVVEEEPHEEQSQQE